MKLTNYKDLVYNLLMIRRFYQDLKKHLEKNKVLVLYGPRQVGKTTLLKNFVKNTSLKYRFDSGDLYSIQQVISSQDLRKIKEYVGDNKLIIIDEAQNIPNVGLGLKIIVDQIPDVYVIATGSSSFELSGQVGEPLTGRKKTLLLLPVALLELKKEENEFDLKQNLEERLICGSYPRIITSRTKKQKQDVLNELVDSYLLKDILKFEKVKGAKIILDLLRLLAFQIGGEVSLSELGQNLGINYKTVKRYLDLLEKSFVIFELRGFSRNLRKEITKKSKYYFYDNGIRNALISNYNSLDLRNDIGQLWENFVISERLKKQNYLSIYSNNYFWRTWDQKEIDWIEEREGKLYGYEIKYQGMASVPEEWQETYANTEFKVIKQDNLLDFVS